MNYLLDTHTFIWLDVKSDNLSENARTILEDAENTIFLSMVSLWEIQIKHQLGKLELRQSLSNIVQDQVENNQLQLLDIKSEHIYGMSGLGDYHRDPFDRLLIAQANHEDLTIVTKDSKITQYRIKTVW